ncbi:MAG: ribosomal L27e protein family-domain-containing protein, partial [Olpidium bornovanus]
RARAHSGRPEIVNYIFRGASEIKHSQPPPITGSYAVRTSSRRGPLGRGGAGAALIIPAPATPSPIHVSLVRCRSARRGGMGQRLVSRAKQNSCAVRFDAPFQVVVVLQGRYAGKKAVVLKNYDEGTKERKYGHALVAGIERYPLPITRRMGKKKAARRSRIKPFIKAVNYNHVMPTRYGIEVDKLKQAVTPEIFNEPTQRVAARKAIKRLFEERYTSGQNSWFFEKLRF